MRVSQLSLQIVALCLAIACFAGCKSFFGDKLDPSPPVGPKLRVVPPETIVGDQPSRWAFNWSKGAGGPYSLSVYIGSGPDNQFHWYETSISGYSIEHDFVLPNDGTTPLTYTGNADLRDRLGYTGGWFGFGEPYDGTDYVVFEVVVLPSL